MSAPAKKKRGAPKGSARNRKMEETVAVYFRAEASEVEQMRSICGLLGRPQAEWLRAMLSNALDQELGGSRRQKPNPQQRALVKRAREAGVSVSEAARILGRSRPHLSAVLNGRRESRSLISAFLALIEGAENNRNA